MLFPETVFNDPGVLGLEGVLKALYGPRTRSVFQRFIKDFLLQASSLVFHVVGVLLVDSTSVTALGGHWDCISGIW